MEVSMSMTVSTMDLSKRSRCSTMPKFLTIIVVLVSLYCLIVFRTITKVTSPTGEPVDWQNLPAKPQFPRHTPLPLPPGTPDPSSLPEVYVNDDVDNDHDQDRGEDDDDEIMQPLTDPKAIGRLYRQLTIVTAFSENHVREAMGLIGSVQSTMPDKVLVVYDLGIENKTLEKVRGLCQIKLRRFPFEKYPPHVSNLHTYAWKVLIINMALREFGAIFWADSSVRFKKSLRHLVPYAPRHHGYMTHFHSFGAREPQDTPLGHIYYFTHPKMFPALGINRKEYYSSHNATPHASANRQLLLRSKYLQRNLVDPLVQCALAYECISPRGAQMGKHRFDASALSLLLYKNMRFEWTAANNDNEAFDDVIDIRRTVLDWHQANECS